MSKEIDLYPEYTGTGLMTVLKLPAHTDPQQVYTTVAEKYREAEQRLIPAASFTGAYRALVSRMSLHTNNSGIVMHDIDGSETSYDEGELLFLGMDASWRAGDEDVDGQFRFAVRPNVADYCAEWDAAERPKNQAAVPKKGWEYIWVQYKDQKRTVDGKPVLVQVPAYVSVDQVHPSADFTALNL